jgi:hypothetical protein
MPPKLKTLPVRLSLPDGRCQAGNLQIQTWNPQAQARRALTAWALCWGSAILGAFVPLVHFVLVPTLLLAGPIAFFVLSRQKESGLGGSGTCPACQAPFAISSGETRERFYDLCTACRAEVTVERISEEFQGSSQADSSI